MKTFSFVLKERNGEQEYSYDYLLYAKDAKKAEREANKLAKSWYDDSNVEFNKDSDCYEFFGGCIAVSIEGLGECSVKNFTRDLVNRFTLGQPN